MASLKFFPVIDNAGGSVITLTSGQNQSVTLGNRVLVRIVATQGVNLRFSANGSVATASDMYLPAALPEIFDMGDMNNTLSIYNSSASSATVYVTLVSRI